MTGMRRGEVLGLRWKNVDLNGAMVRVVESIEETKKGVRFKVPKTEKTRAVALPAFGVDELRRLKKERAEGLALLGIRQDSQTLVGGRADGRPLQPRSLTHEFTRLVARVPELPRVRFHDLRHSHATQMLLAGVHPKVAQERLGHSTITTTLDLYSHVTHHAERCGVPSGRCVSDRAKRHHRGKVKNLGSNLGSKAVFSEFWNSKSRFESMRWKGGRVV
jgi:integrase